ncbi:galactosyl transferase GMA12/MNN10 family protein [Paraphoma chrysanthemicola]|uniref:Galactosyl transferase GMA12/MNN10 family protein n=1 Tax=Paraphoma chrysanthemicola TaxID=798071 RepID=A0A8K0R554_9PLEO|nr:galactosyl transferase GMA12/MNN10 family protein [Paraphoma chrysanthemicola]
MYLSSAKRPARYHTIKELSVPYARPVIRPIPQFIASGTSECLPPTTTEMIEQAVRKRATCRKYSPFTTDRARIATVTAHFGGLDEHYQRAFESHLLHSLIHGTEVRVICDPIVDDLWNKPAFILNLLMREMLKPEKERLEWIMWVDRDTIILDQCRPISSFLPPTKPRVGSWWRRSDNQEKNVTDVNLLLTNDFNGLNNGIFLLRVNEWAIRLFTAILAFRHYEPDIVLPYTEQTAMGYVIETEEFKNQTRMVPQHWFNAYTKDDAQTFAERDDSTELDEVWVRRGDLLVHFPGHPDKGTVIDEWVQMLSGLPDVWEAGTVQRDVSEEVDDFWKEVRYGGRK